MKYKIIILISLALLLWAGIFVLSKKKTDNFTFSKTTDNYIAQAGDKNNGDTHKIRLTYDPFWIEFTLLSVSTQQQSNDKQSKIKTAIYRVLDYLNNKKRLSIQTKADIIDTTNERKVFFSNIAENTNIEYSLNEGGIKEEIILQSPTVRNNVYTFRINTQGLHPKNQGNGVWYFYHGNDPIFRIPKGWAKDAKGSFTNDVVIDILLDQLTITVDKEWLDSQDRVFPIIIDPTVEVVPERRKTRQ